ncbi:MAG: PAS domain-containing protein [Gammaproteobacteria bacterium]|nr:PAS domain-containing protein [Gammaproteobacteria bacterium]
MSIVKKITLLLLMAGLIPLIIGLYWNHIRAVEQINKRSLSSIEVYAKRQSLNWYNQLSHMKQEIRRIASTSYFSLKAPELLDLYKTETEQAKKFKDLFRMFEKASLPLAEANYFYDFFIINLQGDVLYSVKKEADLFTNLETGAYRETQLAHVFRSALKLENLTMSDFEYYEPSQTSAAFMSEPIINEGKIVAVLATQINISRIYELILNHSELGSTGETIIASRKGDKALFLNALKNHKNTAFTQSVKLGSDIGLPIQKAVQGSSGSGIFKDYRGVEVMASWRYLPFARIGLVVKQDTAEFYSEVRQLEQWAIISALISLTLLIYVIWYISKLVYQLNNSYEQYNFAIDGSNDALWDWDIANQSVFFSKRWKSMLGYSEAEIPSEFQQWSERVHPDDFVRLDTEIKEANSSPGYQFENIHRLKHKNGNWIWVLDRGKTIFDSNGKAIRMVGFHTDITPMKELEEKLEKQHNKLEKSFRQLQESEEIMIAQSRHAAMGEMIGMIAHQWRQPITVIAMGANNMLVDIDLDEINAEAFKRHAYSILKQTEHLSQTIDDFRNFFRPERSKEIVWLGDVMKEAISIIGKSLENNRVELSVVHSPSEHKKKGKKINIYSRELLQVYINLLKNSKEVLVEKCPVKRKIEVVITEEAEHVITRICDNGGGIDKAIIDHIFEPYFSTKDKKTGTGLGLYMSKTIIEQHLNGTLMVNNTADGACFTISIPTGIHTKNAHIAKDTDND